MSGPIPTHAVDPAVHPCEFACAAGTCGGASGPNPCGGCCACLGPCLIDYENTHPDAPPVAYKPISHIPVAGLNDAEEPF